MWLSALGEPPAHLPRRLRPQRAPPAVPDHRGRRRDPALGGYRERNVRVWLDAARLEAQGLTVQDVKAAIAREHLEVPAGRIESARARDERPRRGRGHRRRGLPQPRGHLPQRRARPPAGRGGGGGRPRGPAPRRARHGRARPSASASRKLRGANAVQVGRDVRPSSPSSRQQLPEGVYLDVNFDSIRLRRGGDQRDPLHPGPRGAPHRPRVLDLPRLLVHHLNVLLAIPTSILGHVHRHVLLGFTLNTYTVLGLTLVVGIVVDDAIMVLENIYRHREEGEGKVQGRLARRARDHLRRRRGHARHRRHLPARGLHEGDHREVLLPVRRHDLGGGAASRCSRRSPSPRCAARASSRWASARAASARVVEHGFDRLAASYLRVLVPALHHRGRSSSARRSSSCSRSLSRSCPRSSCPSQDMGRFNIRFLTPVGTSMRRDGSRPRGRSRRTSRSRPEVDRYFGFVGGFGGGEVNSGIIFVTMKDRASARSTRRRDAASRSRSSWTSRAGRRERHPGRPRHAPGPLAAGLHAAAAAASRWSSTIRGRDWDTLARASQRDHGPDARGRAGDRHRQRLPGRHARGPGGPRPQQGGRPRHLAWPTIGETINAAIGGVRVGKFKDKGRRFDIRVRLLAPQRAAARGHRAAPRAHRHRRASSASATSSASSSGPSLQAITRNDRERAITIFGNVAPGRLAGRRHRRHDGDRPARSCPTATARCPSGSSQAFARGASSRSCFAFVLGLSSPTWCWPRSSTRSPTRSRCSWPCPSASAARCWRSPRGPEHQRLQHARPHPADGHRQEELDHARRLHEPDPRARASSGTRRCCRPARSACARS